VQIIQRGTGAPLVLIPGLQGKWEYLAPAVDALAGGLRVITFPLCGEPGSTVPLDGSDGFDHDVAQVVAVLDHLGIEEAIICGISLGGLIAIRFAALHPRRTRALILASTPGPGWRIRKRHALYTRVPWLFGPLFLAEAPRRLSKELAAAFPDRARRRAFMRSQLRLLATARLSLTRMAARARMIASADFAAEAGRIVAPTLIVTGEPLLDYVVPAEGSSEYVRLIRGARAVVLERTGHLGSVTRPEAFAAAVREFVATLERDRLVSSEGALFDRGPLARGGAPRRAGTHDAA
jgi:3-oxoadipate enol-lactonase